MSYNLLLILIEILNNLKDGLRSSPPIMNNILPESSNILLTSSYNNSILYYNMYCYPTISYIPTTRNYKYLFRYAYINILSIPMYRLHLDNAQNNFYLWCGWYQNNRRLPTRATFDRLC